MKTFTAATVRKAYKAGGLSHAEFCLEEAESQLGRDKCKEARAEFNRLCKEEAV
jgi:hypothetical protein